MLSIRKISTIDYFKDGNAASLREGMLVQWQSGPQPPSGNGVVLGQKPAAAVVDLDLDCLVSGDVPVLLALSRLFKGENPRTGRKVSRDVRRGATKALKMPGGYEIQCSFPKSVSLLADLGDIARPGLKKEIVKIQREALSLGLELAFDLGLITTRQDHRFLAVAQCGLVMFHHDTSRADDPLLHVHALLVKTAYASDGSIMQIDNKVLKDHQGALAALIRCEEVRLLRERLGITLLPDNRNYRVAGIPDELCAMFSKRRAEIVRILDAVGKHSADNRTLAEKIAYDTRQAKSHATADALRDIWRSEMVEAGWTPEALLHSVDAVVNPLDIQTDLERFEAARIAALAAIARHAAEKGTFAYADFHRVAFEAMQCHGIGAVTALTLAKNMVLQGDVVRVSSRERGPIFTTREMQERERDIIVKATALRAAPFKVEGITALQHVRELGATVSESELTAWFLRKPGLAIFDHAEGASEFKSLRMICHALDTLGVTVIGVAGSPQRLPRLQTLAGLSLNICLPLGDLFESFARGGLPPNSRFAIVAADAEDISSSDMHRLLSGCVDANAPLLLSGNLTAARLAGGPCPFKLLSRLKPPLTAQAVAEEERYKGFADAAWMNAAAIDFSSGQTSRALEAYDRMGRISWNQSRNQAVDAAIGAYVDHLRDLPDQIGAITTLWPKDAYAIRDAARGKLKKLRQIASEDVVVMALSLESADDKPVSMPLSEGDVIVFGEDIALPDRQIAKGQTAVVTRIEKGPSADISLVLRLIGREQPQEICKVLYSALVGHREGNMAPFPKIQHVYGLSAEAARDLAFDAVFDVALRPRGHDETREASTRHRQSLRVFVDLGRVQDDRRAEASTRVVRANHGLLVFPPDPVPRMDIEDLKRVFFAECDRERSDRNISDDIPRDCLRAWANGKLPDPEVNDRPMPPTDVFRFVPLPRRSDLRLTPATLTKRIWERIAAPKGHRVIWELLAQRGQSGDGSVDTRLLISLGAFIKGRLSPPGPPETEKATETGPTVPDPIGPTDDGLPEAHTGPM